MPDYIPHKFKEVPMSRRLAARVRRMFINVWPTNCPICDRKLSVGETTVCLKCLAEMNIIKSDTASPYVGAPGNSVTVRSWFIYDHHEPCHRLIHLIKYHDCRKLARKLGREFAYHKLDDNLQIDAILPVPLHWTKFVSRSYNQTREIARGIKDVLDIEILTNLYALRPHHTQTHRNKQERIDNVKGIFGVRRPQQLNGRHIALLDDVITTGATMFSAIESILEVSAPASVTFLSLARTKLT